MDTEIDTVLAESRVKVVTKTVDMPAISHTALWEPSKEYNFTPNSWMGQFPETYDYQGDGESGTLTGKKIILTPANRETNRTVVLTGSWTDSAYRPNSSLVNAPATISRSYVDPASGATITRNVPKSGGLVIANRRSETVFSSSYGRAENYDPQNNTRLGYMSNNTTTYYNGTYRYSNPPRRPSDYYGPDGGTYGNTGWTLVEIDWDECCVRDANDARWHHLTRQFQYRWRSDAGNFNRYRKGVYLKYSKNVTTYQYRQNYSGTYALPDVATLWNVQVVYEGVINRYPEVKLTYEPQNLYEGDTVTLTADPYDADGDLMTVILEENIDGTWYELKREDEVDTAEKVTHDMRVSERDYHIRARVIDTQNASGSDEVNFRPLPLEINGFVYHTPDWQAIHERHGHSEDKFFAGEIFKTKALVTDHPIDKVTVTFRSDQINGEVMQFTQNMTPNPHPEYVADVFNEQMGDPQTRLANGEVIFLFTAKWANGIVKQDIVRVNIEDGVYKAFNFHRTN